MENVFTDKSKCNILDTMEKKKYDETSENLVSTVKHGGGSSVIVWGSMAAPWVGNLVFIETTVDYGQYLNILKNNFRPLARKLQFGNRWSSEFSTILLYTSTIWMDPIQLTSLTTWLEPNRSPLEWFGKENKKLPITCKQSLKNALQAVWAETSPDVTENLVLSMYTRACRQY